MTQAVDNYVKAHGHEINRSEMKQNKWNKSNIVSADKAGQNVSGPTQSLVIIAIGMATELRTVKKDCLQTNEK